MKRILIFLLLFCLQKLDSQINIINTGTTENIWNVSMLGANNVIINGEETYLSRSIDECNTLTVLTSPSPAGYNGYLDRLDINTSYLLAANFAAYNNKIYKSATDCNNWTLTLDTSGLSIDFLRFFDSNEGIAVSTFNKLLRTKTGGSSWGSGSYPFYVATCIEIYGDSMVCVGGVNGGVGGYFLSKDRGNTWGSGGDFGTLSEPRDFFFLNKDTIFAIGSLGWYGPFLNKSYNGGTTWIKDTIANNSPYGVYFKSAAEGYILGMSTTGLGVIMKTSDLGQSWTTFNTQIPTQLLRMKFLNDSIALVSGTGGILFKWNSKTTIFTSTGIKDNNFNDLDIKIYPNPTKDKIKIKFKDDIVKGLKIKVTNVLGETYFESDLIISNREIDLKIFPSGIYFINISDNEREKVMKIVKE